MLCATFSKTSAIRAAPRLAVPRPAGVIARSAPVGGPTADHGMMMMEPAGFEGHFVDAPAHPHEHPGAAAGAAEEFFSYEPSGAGDGGEGDHVADEDFLDRIRERLAPC